MNLIYFGNTPRASRPQALNKPGQDPIHDAASHRDAPLQPGRTSATADFDGADTACEARATSIRERWRLPTGISERELFAGDGGNVAPYYGEGC